MPRDRNGGPAQQGIESVNSESISDHQFDHVFVKVFSVQVLANKSDGDTS